MYILCKISIVLGKFSLLKMAKYWTHNIAIWSHWLFSTLISDGVIIMGTLKCSPSSVMFFCWARQNGHKFNLSPQIIVHSHEDRTDAFERIRTIGRRVATVGISNAEQEDPIHLIWIACNHDAVDFEYAGSGCGSVGRVVASYSGGLGFESCCRQLFLMNIFTANCWKDEIKQKEAGIAHFLNKSARSYLCRFTGTWTRAHRGQQHRHSTMTVD